MATRNYSGKKSPKSQVLLAIMLVTLTVRAGAWLVYYFHPSRRHMEGRTHDEKEYIYKCENGHIFKAMGREAPRPCEIDGCNADSYLYMMFSCPKGHRIGVLLRTDPDEYRFDEYSPPNIWKPFNVDNFIDVSCPKCFTPGLMPALESPG